MTDAPRQPPPSPTHAVPSSSATHPAVSLTTQPPALPSSPPAMWRARTCAPFSISFSRAPLISLCSRMRAERAASPTLKITTSVWQGWWWWWWGWWCLEGVRGWMAVDVAGWGGGGGSSHSSQAQDLTAVTAHGEEWWGKGGGTGGRVLYFCENPQHAKCRACAAANKKS